MLVVSDVRLYREGLAESLSRFPQVDLVGTSRAQAEAVSSLAAHQPDVVLLGLTSPEDLTLVTAIRNASPASRVVAFAVAEAEDQVLACAEAGVAGYVSREASLSDVVAVIESVAREELPCSPRMAASLFRRLGILAAERTATRPPDLTLTSRERQIVDLVDRGLSNKEIARCLSVEVATVKNHVHSILEKLHVGSRGEAAALLRRSAPRAGWGRSGSVASRAPSFGAPPRGD